MTQLGGIKKLRTKKCKENDESYQECNLSSYREESYRLRRQFNSSPDLKARSILLSDAHIIEDEDDHIYSIQKPNPSFVDHLNNKSTVASKDGLFTYLGRPTA